jgi:glycogen synthase
VRLLLLNHELPPVGGGAGNATWFIAKALHTMGHEVRIVTGSYRDLPRLEMREGIGIERIPSLRRRLDRSNTLEMLSFLAAALIRSRRLQDSNPDATIAFFSIPAGVVTYWMHRRWHTPYLISLRGGDVPGLSPEISWIHRLITPLRRRVLRSSAAVVANAKGLAELTERADGIRVDIVHNGVDLEFFTPGQRTAGSDVIVLFVGRFHPQKNLHALLESVAEASQILPLRLDMVGDGPERESLHAHARRLGIEDRIRWLGWLDKPDLLAAYQRADVFVNPSHYEGMPNTVLEAMACALPVLASRIGGNTELVRHECTGLLFDLVAREQMTESLVRLAQDPRLRRSLGCSGREFVAREFSWQHVAGEYARLLCRSSNGQGV